MQVFDLLRQLLQNIQNEIDNRNKARINPHFSQ